MAVSTALQTQPGKLCLGGAFNPIHHGHLLCARAAAEALNIPTVVLIPNHVPPLQKLHPAIAAEHRVEMCRLAVAGFGGFEVDDREVRRPGPSYTIDTVRELRREGWPIVPWLIGADQVNSLPKWRQPQDLLAETHFLILARPGCTVDWITLPPEYRPLAQRVVAAPAIDISSTDIRRRVAAGRSIDFLTPPAVCQYIMRHGLYRN